MFEEEQNDVPPQLNGGRRKSRAQKSKKAQKGKKTRKMAKGPSDWNKKVMMIYRQMKQKDKNVKFGAAMKEASPRKKAGKL
jgi:hypothetical protein